MIFKVKEHSNDKLYRRTRCLNDIMNIKITKVITVIITLDELLYFMSQYIDSTLSS